MYGAPSPRGMSPLSTVARGWIGPTGAFGLDEQFSELTLGGAIRNRSKNVKSLQELVEYQARLNERVLEYYCDELQEYRNLAASTDPLPPASSVASKMDELANMCDVIRENGCRLHELGCKIEQWLELNNSSSDAGDL